MAKKIDHAKEAAWALSDLNMLYAIKALTENRLTRDCETAERQIGRICIKRADYLLRRYDRHIALARLTNQHKEGV